MFDWFVYHKKPSRAAGDRGEMNAIREELAVVMYPEHISKKIIWTYDKQVWWPEDKHDILFPWGLLFHHINRGQ